MKTRIAFGWIGIAIGLCFFLACSKKKTEEAAGKVAPGATTVVPLMQINLPENVVGLLTIAKPQELTQKLEALAALVSPMPSGMLSNMLSNSFSRLGLKDPTVVDLGGPMAIAVLNPKIFKDPALAFLTVKGEDAVVASLQPFWNHQGVKDGIHEFSREETDPYQAFSDDKNAAPPKKIHTLYLKFLGKVMVASGYREAFNIDLGALKKLAETSEPSGAQLILLIDRIREIFKAELATALSAANEALTKSLQKPGTKPSPESVALTRWLADKLFSAVNQIRDLRIVLSARDDGLIGQFNLTPETGSFFSKILAAQTPQPLHLISALPPTQLMAFDANMQLKPFKNDLKELFMNLLQALFNAPPPPEWLSLIDEQLAVLGDEFVVSEDIANKSIHFMELVEVTDETRTKELLPKIMALSQKVMTGNSLIAYKIGVPKDLSSYQGVELKAFEMSIDMKKASPQKTKMAKQLYGEKFTMVYGVFDKLMGIAMGVNAESEMHQVIDRVRKHSNEIPAAVKNAGGELLADAGGFMFFSVNQAITGTIQAMGQQAPVPQGDQTPSGIFARFGSSPDRFTMTLRVPADHLKELSATMQALIQASVMKGMMSPGPAEEPRAVK